MELAAEVSFEEGLTKERISGETIRATLFGEEMGGVRWQRAKRWITSPDPEYARKKGRRDRLMALAEGDPHTRVVGFCDECWWSRLARPSLHSISEEGEPLGLVEQSVAKDAILIRKPSAAATGSICRSSHHKRGCASLRGARSAA
jgi:hypothetical protein